MTASDKIEEAKECFQVINKSGKNNYQHYDYFELKDILPIVRKVCKKFKLKTRFDWDIPGNMMTLTVTDKEDNSTETYSIPVANPNDAKAGNYMQSIGSIQTYAMRYLYIQCFEITVPDEIDNKDNRPKEQLKQKVQQQKSKPQQQKPIQKASQTEPEPTNEDIKQALDTVYNIIVTQGNKELTIDNALFQLRRQYRGKTKLIQACEESLKTSYKLVKKA